MTTEERKINPNEDKKLRKEIKAVWQDLNAPLKWTWIISFSILTVLSAIHIYYFDESNWSLISKILVCIGPICIWQFIEIKYKGRKKKQKYLKELQTLADQGTIEILKINSKRAILFKEKEDEGNLYLIEDISGSCIYLWDDQVLIPEKLKFPKATNEIYLDKSFIWALSSKVNCYGEVVELIKVAGDKKWNLFKESGFPNDLEKTEKSFDTLLTEIKNTT